MPLDQTVINLIVVNNDEDGSKITLKSYCSLFRVDSIESGLPFIRKNDFAVGYCKIDYDSKELVLLSEKREEEVQELMKAKKYLLWFVKEEVGVVVANLFNETDMCLEPRLLQTMQAMAFLQEELLMYKSMMVVKPSQLESEEKVEDEPVNTVLIVEKIVSLAKSEAEINDAHFAKQTSIQTIKALAKCYDLIMTGAVESFSNEIALNSWNTK